MAQIEKVSGSSGSVLNRQRSGKARLASETISGTGQAQARIQDRRPFRERRRALPGRSPFGASAAFLAHYLSEPVFLPEHPLDARREVTLAYIGADMLPELLAETRRARFIDRKF